MLGVISVTETFSAHDARHSGDQMYGVERGTHTSHGVEGNQFIRVLGKGGSGVTGEMVWREKGSEC